ncbi:MAG: hypothetical protein CMM32_11090 [Rhodospirillaceae bacterium]|nr:hypothetical protein [Rhodospirillaceae bacterium]
MFMEPERGQQQNWKPLHLGIYFVRILGLLISLLDISWIHRLSWEKLLEDCFLRHSLCLQF